MPHLLQTLLTESKSAQFKFALLLLLGFSGSGTGATPNSQLPSFKVYPSKHDRQSPPIGLKVLHNELA